MFLMMLAAIAAQPQKVSHRVTVNGAVYRVTVRGEAVEVAKKKLVVKPSLAERDAQRSAVTRATGCRIVDELDFSEARLKGRLDCSQRPS